MEGGEREKKSKVVGVIAKSEAASALKHLSTHLQGSGCSHGEYLPGTFRERLLKTGFFHPRQCYIKKKKPARALKRLVHTWKLALIT